MEKLYEIHERGDYDLLDPRHAAVAQRPRLPRRPPAARPVHRGALAAAVHQARRESAPDREPGRLGGLHRARPADRPRPARGPLRVLHRDRRDDRRLPRARRARQRAARSAEGTEFVIVCGPAGDPIEEAVYLREQARRGRPAARRGRRQPDPHRSSTRRREAWLPPARAAVGELAAALTEDEDAHRPALGVGDAPRSRRQSAARPTSRRSTVRGSGRAPMISACRSASPSEVHELAGSSLGPLAWTPPRGVGGSSRGSKGCPPRAPSRCEGQRSNWP